MSRAVAFGFSAALVAGCELGQGGLAGDEALVMSDVPRAEPSIAAEELDAQVRANTEFAAALYHQLRAGADEDENLFVSPYSISVALAMTHAGARGETAEEMSEVLGFELPDDGHHAAFNAIDQALAARPGEVQEEDATLELSVANALWAQDAYPVQEPFLDVLAEHYGTGARLLEFSSEPERARDVINEWVSARTEERIPELLPAGSIDDLTRFVLTNAIYLRADWLHPFEAQETTEAGFELEGGGEARVERMHQIVEIRHAEGDGYQVAALPYVGEKLSMALMVPDEGRFAEVEANLDAALLQDALAAAEAKDVELGLPKFEFSSDYDLVPHLEDLGMTSAFDKDRADFSGIHGGADPSVHLTGVFHEAFVAVDEEGTEASAATGAVGGATSLPNVDVSLLIDRPFLFAIVDEGTGTVLFLGRVLDPSAGG